MAKKIYKDGQYTGEEHLTEQEHQERQEAYAAADRGLRELLDHPYVKRSCQQSEHPYLCP